MLYMQSVPPYWCPAARSQRRGSNGNSMVNLFRATADRENFIIVSPTGNSDTGQGVVAIHHVKRATLCLPNRIY